MGICVRLYSRLYVSWSVVTREKGGCFPRRCSFGREQRVMETRSTQRAKRRGSPERGQSHEGKEPQLGQQHAGACRGPGCNSHSQLIDSSLTAH